MSFPSSQASHELQDEQEPHRGRPEAHQVHRGGVWGTPRGGAQACGVTSTHSPSSSSSSFYLILLILFYFYFIFYFKVNLSLLCSWNLFLCDYIWLLLFVRFNGIICFDVIWNKFTHKKKVMSIIYLRKIAIKSCFEVGNFKRVFGIIICKLLISQIIFF